jgi:outer membrane protein assembly factor BamB
LLSAGQFLKARREAIDLLSQSFPARKENMTAASPRARTVVSILIGLVSAALAAHGSARGGDWPRFRGPNGTGISSDKGVPLEWSAEKNIVWRRELPGHGASSPITFGDHVYVTSYSGYALSERSPGELRNLKRHLSCIDRKSGRILWQADVPIGKDMEVPFGGFLVLHGYATNTPVADESGVYAYFGTSGMLAYDHDGKPLWRKKLGEGINGWGTSSSPLVFGDLVIVHAEIEAQALVALDKKTGREKWRFRTGTPDSWSTPLLMETGGRPELVYHHTQDSPRALLGAVDPRDGTELWQCRVLKDYLCPTPIAQDGIIFVLGYQRAAAVRAGGRGDVTSSHVQWTINKGTEICTPVYHDGHLYWAHQEDGIAYCLNAKTGKVVYEDRLNPRPGRMYASGVLAEGRLYYVSREKGTYVVAAEPRFRLLAHNQIETDDSVFNASPAISHGQLLLRSDKFLYCVGTRSP